MSHTVENTTAAAEIVQRDRDLLIHPYLPSSVEERVVMREGKGCTLRDIEGREYLDATGGLWLAQVGHGRAELAAAAAKQIEQLEYFMSFWEFSNERAIELAQRLVSLSPESMSHVYFTSGGSEGNEAAIKMARYHHHRRGENGRNWIIARRSAYHGVGYGSGNGNGLPDLPRGVRADAAERPARHAAMAISLGPVRRRGPDRLLPARAATGDR